MNQVHPPARVFKKPKLWKWYEYCFYWQICCLSFIYLFIFGQASGSVYHLVWNASQSVKSFDDIWFSAALMLCSRCYKNRHFVCQVPGEGKKKADNVLDANNGCQWHRGWHQTLFVYLLNAFDSLVGIRIAVGTLESFWQSVNESCSTCLLQQNPDNINPFFW